MEIKAKNYNFTIKPRTCLSTDKFDFFVDISNKCDAQCLFCCNDNKSDDEVDLNQFEIDFLKVKDKVARVVVSGGEPLIDPVKLEDLLKLLFSFDVNVKLITNGHSLEKRLVLLDKYGVGTVQLSRHHYHDNQNDNLFVNKALSIEKFGEAIKQYKRIHFSVNCLLIKGYVDSTGEVIKYLECCSQVGIDSVKFVGLMKVNDYCCENFIDYKSIIRSLPLDFLKTDERVDEDRCSCAHFIYIAENGTMIDVRFRHIAIFTQTDRVVKFDSDGIGRF